MTTLTVNTIQDGSTTSGLTFDSASSRTYLTVADWNFQQDDTILYPIGKTKVTYIPTGADQTFVVPVGVTYIFVKLWGAGGAGANAVTTSWTGAGFGGGGGHTYGLIPVTPGETLYLVVGVAGQTNYTGAQTPRYGGGGGLYSNNANNVFCGSGGGYCGIFRTSISQANALLIAGGGGGGGASRHRDGNWGGAGGGLTGQQGNSPYDNRATSGGGPGTQSAGGAAGATQSTIGIAGSALTGGYGSSDAYGGGGGGGYYGGGGGGYYETYTMGGGGGGSGYIKSTVLLGATFTGTANIPANQKDNDLPKTYDTYNGWQKYAFGGDTVRNAAVQYTAIGGGGAVCVIYY